MKFKYKFLLLLIAISLVGCLYVSQSYAFWMITKEQNTANQITSGCFSIDFKENNGNINLTNTYPVSDQLGLSQTPYEFIVTNTCTISVNYNVTLTTISSSNVIADSNIKYVLHKKNNGNLPSTGNKLNSGTSAASGTSYLLESGSLAGGTRNGASVNPGGSVTYDLYLWIDSNADNSLMGKTFEARVDVSAGPSNT